MAQDKIFVPVEFNADIEDFEKKIKSARDLVKAFAKEVKGVKRFGASFEEIEKVSASLGKALGNVNKRVENLSDRLDKNAQRNEEAAEKLEKTKEKAEKAAAALKETKEQTKRLSDELKKTKEKTEGLGRGLDKTKDKTKDTGKGFGKLGEGAAEGAYALTNLQYIISDLPYGFIGIQNNIDPLVASFTRLNTSTGGVSSSLKVLGGLLSGPTGIFLGISALSSLALMFGEDIKQAFGQATKAALKYKNVLQDIIIEQKYALSGINGEEGFARRTGTVADLPVTLDQVELLEKQAEKASSKYKEVLDSFYKVYKETRKIGDKELKESVFKRLLDEIIKDIDIAGEDYKKKFEESLNRVLDIRISDLGKTEVGKNLNFGGVVYSAEVETDKIKELFRETEALSNASLKAREKYEKRQKELYDAYNELIKDSGNEVEKGFEKEKSIAAERDRILREYLTKRENAAILEGEDVYELMSKYSELKKFTDEYAKSSFLTKEKNKQFKETLAFLSLIEAKVKKILEQPINTKLFGDTAQSLKGTNIATYGGGVNPFKDVKLFPDDGEYDREYALPKMEEPQYQFGGKDPLGMESIRSQASESGAFEIDTDKMRTDIVDALRWEEYGEIFGSSLMTGVDMFASKLSQELWTIKNLSKVQIGNALEDAAKMFGQEMTRQLIKLAAQKLILNVITQGAAQGASGGVDGFSGFDPSGFVAVGTKNAQRGYTLVGEEGPELVYMRGGEEVLTAAETRKELEAPQTALTDDGLEETESYSANEELREILKKPLDNSLSKYANGTRYAMRGFAVVGERGREAIFRRANETASNLSAIQSAGFERREMSAYGSGNDMLANEIRALRQDNQRLNKDLSLVDDAGKVIADKTNRSNLIAKNLKVS